MRSNKGHLCDKQELRELVQKYETDKNLKTPFSETRLEKIGIWVLCQGIPSYPSKNQNICRNSEKTQESPTLSTAFMNYLDGDDNACFIFNAYESGFHSDLSRVRAIGHKGKALRRVSGGSGRESTTDLACVSADGRCLPPLIVFKGAAVQPRLTI